MSYRSCTNDDCSDKGNNWDGTSYDANTLINLSSLGANRYFQFKANFKIIEVGETPTIPEPDSIPGLALWLKADAITGVSDGQKISTWNDSSGNNRNFSQGTSSRQPTYETNELNGLPVIRFIGSSIQTMTNSTNFSAPVTVIYMVRQTGGYNNRMLSGLSNNWLLGYWSSAKNKAYFVGWVTSSTAGSPATDTSWHTYSAVIPGSSASSAYGDGALLASNSGGVSGPNGLSLSGHQASSEFSNGEIAEVIVYNSALNTTNRETVEAYLAEKYGFSPAQEPQIFPQATPKLADVNIVYTN